MSADRVKTLEIVGVLCAAFGFVLFGVGFWDAEKILWNRRAYSVGQWSNSLPIHRDDSIDSLLSRMDQYLLQYQLGMVILAVGLVFLIIAANFADLETFSSIKLALIGITAGMASFIGFWTHESTYAGPVGWFEEASQSKAEAWRLMGIVTSILFGVLLLAVIAVGIRKHFEIQRAKEEKQPKEKDTRPLLQRIADSLPFYLVLGMYLLFTLAPVFIAIFVSISKSEDLIEGEYTIDSAIKGVMELDVSAVVSAIEALIDAFILNYSSVLFSQSEAEPAFATAFTNSIILGIGTAAIGISISLTAGYALARFKFKGNKFATFVILATQMFPGLILLIPQYLIWKELGLLDKEPFELSVLGFVLETNIGIVLFGVLIAYATGAVAYCTWMLKGYFETIPIDLEEASLIDGCGSFGAFWRIAVPLAKPGMAAIALFTFLTAWQEFILARTFIGEGNVEQSTLPLLLYNYQNLGVQDRPVYFEVLAPYAILIAFPIVLLFMILQKQIAATTAGGVK